MDTKSLEELEKRFEVSPETSEETWPTGAQLTMPMRSFGIMQVSLLTFAVWSYSSLLEFEVLRSATRAITFLVSGLICFAFMVIGDRERVDRFMDPFCILRRWHSRKKRPMQASIDISRRYQILLERVRIHVDRFKEESLGEGSPIGKARADFKSIATMIHKTKGRCAVYNATQNPLTEELVEEISQTEKFLARVETAIEAEAGYIEQFCAALIASVGNLDTDLQIERDIVRLRGAREVLRNIDATTIPQTRIRQSLFLGRLSNIALVLKDATDSTLGILPNSTDEANLFRRAKHYVSLEEPTRAAFAQLTERLCATHELSLSPALETPTE